MTLADGITALEDIFFYTSFAGQTWLMYLVIIFATMFIITRKWSDWNTIALPVMIGWKYFGMPIPTVFFLVAGLVFVIDILSLDIIAGAFNGIGEALTRSGRAKGYKRRMDFKQEIKELKRTSKRDWFRDQEKIRKLGEGTALHKATMARDSEGVERDELTVRGFKADLEAQDLDTIYRKKETDAKMTLVDYNNREALAEMRGKKIAVNRLMADVDYKGRRKSAKKKRQDLHIASLMTDVDYKGRKKTAEKRRQDIEIASLMSDVDYSGRKKNARRRRQDQQLASKMTQSNYKDREMLANTQRLKNLFNFRKSLDRTESIATRGSTRPIISKKEKSNYRVNKQRKLDYENERLNLNAMIARQKKSGKVVDLTPQPKQIFFPTIKIKEKLKKKPEKRKKSKRRRKLIKVKAR